MLAVLTFFSLFLDQLPFTGDSRAAAKVGR
jgi:hypothetical protein